MALASWFNANRHRSYPFLAGSTGRAVVGPASVAQLPDATIVDAGFLLGAASQFISATDSVYLLRVRRASDVFYFDFAATTAQLFGAVLTFQRAATAARYVTEFVDSQATHGLSESAEVCDAPLWSGFLVTGDLAALAALLPDDGSLERFDDADALVEPALLQNLAGSYVTSVALANNDRVRITAADGCDPVTWPFETGVIFIWTTCLQDDLVFMPGFNMRIEQDDASNQLTFSPVLGAGAGPPCSEVPVFPGEEPVGANTLSGGPACSGVLRSINGTGGQRFELTGGLGVTVTPLPAAATVVIDINFAGMALCLQPSENGSSS